MQNYCPLQVKITFRPIEFFYSIDLLFGSDRSSSSQCPPSSVSLVIKLSGLCQVFKLTAYFVVQSEPKILRLVPTDVHFVRRFSQVSGSPRQWSPTCHVREIRRDFRFTRSTMFTLDSVLGMTTVTTVSRVSMSVAGLLTLLLRPQPHPESRAGSHTVQLPHWPQEPGQI